ncbi:MAG: hypothetical protein MI919_36920 [Holophagales bacterium]|nr:hypothetical protein [Holophagales bacterium]
MARQFFSGNSIEQAVLSAARHYEIEPESVAYKVREKKHGFINLRKRVVIEVDPEAPKLPEPEIEQRRQETGHSDLERLTGPAIPKDDRGAFVIAGGHAREDGKPAYEDGPRAGEERGEEDRPDTDRGDGDRADRWAEDLEDRWTDAPDDQLEEDSDGESEYDDDRESDRDNGNSADPRAKDRDRRPELDRRPDRGGQDRGSRGGRDRDRDDRSRSARGRDSHARDSHGRDDRGRGDRGRSRRGRGGRQRDTKVLEHFWEGADWDEMELEEGVSKELGAYELAVEKVLDVMDLDIEYTIEEGEVFEIEFSGEDEDILTEENGKVLKAIEHILPRAARTLIGKAIPCRVDCNGFQAEHEEDLMILAKEAAEEVSDSGRSRLLPPMTPADRRIVHLALVDNPHVDTSSEGSGYLKRVRVISVEEDDY